MKCSFLILLCIIFNCHLISAQTSYYANNKGVDIHYQTYGEGKPILIVNGGPGFSSEGFSFVAQKIADLGYQTILFDQRGTGKSKVEEVTESTVSMDLMVEDIEAIRQAMNLEKWTVLGHSFGGILTNYYATKHPERIKAMIQSSSGGVDLSLFQYTQRILSEQFTAAEADSLSYWRSRFNDPDYPNARKQHNLIYAKAYVYDEQYVPIIAERLMQGNLSLNAHIWRDLRSMPYDCKKELSSFCQPVLIIQGEQDIVAKEIAQLADETYCNSTLTFLEKCGHYGWLDQEEQYLGAIDRFLKLIAKL